MNKSAIRIGALLGMLSCGSMYATSEFRSPEPLRERGPIHYRLEPVQDTYWYALMNPEDHKDSKWETYTWKGAYYRSACKAFFDDDLDCDGKPKNKSTSKTTGLTTLFFGIDEEVESFVAAQAFAGGSISPAALATSTNALAWAHIKPDLKYTEKGAVFGLSARRTFGRNDNWHFGTRMSLPFVLIDVEQRACPGEFEETLADVCRMHPLNQDLDADPDQTECAYRLDFLSSLLWNYQNLNGQQVPVPFLQYGNGNDQEMKIGNHRLSYASANVAEEQPPAYVQRRVDGTPPSIPYRKLASQVSGALGANGSGGGNDDVLFFLQGTNYLAGLGQDVAAQTELWLEPRQNDASQGPNVPDQLVNAGQAICNEIKTLIDMLGIPNQESATEFLKRECGIDLCSSECIKGLGDLESDFYLGYGPGREWYVNVVTGVRWPTGKPHKDSGRVYFQSTGHNRHFEMKIGMEGGWMPCKWFAFDIDWAFHHAFERTEKRAAPFKGATIRNIGPEIDAKVKWDYYTFHTNLTFFHPNNPDLGCVLSYELFGKRNDEIHLGCPDLGCNGGYAVDCLGQRNELDFTLLEKRTDSMTHKIRGEVFYRANFWELFVGASQIVAGRNAMQETEAHLGVAIYF